jgi:hypothetical protein
MMPAESHVTKSASHTLRSLCLGLCSSFLLTDTQCGLPVRAPGNKALLHVEIPEHPVPMTGLSSAGWHAWQGACFEDSKVLAPSSLMSSTDTILKAEGLRALTPTQAQQLINHNLAKIAHLEEQNQHLLVRCLAPLFLPATSSTARSYIQTDLFMIIIVS